MKTDIYTKSVLTVIAICLFVSTFTPYDFISKAHATEVDKISEILSKPTEVRIVSVAPDVMIDANLTKILGWKVAASLYDFDLQGEECMAPIVYSVSSR